MLLFSEDITSYELTDFRDIENIVRTNLSNNQGVKLKLIGKIYVDGEILFHQ